MSWNKQFHPIDFQPQITPAQDLGAGAFYVRPSMHPIEISNSFRMDVLKHAPSFGARNMLNNTYNDYNNSLPLPHDPLKW